MTPSAVSDQMHRTVEVPALPQRIVSLVPSQTELLYDLGLGERVVGITKFCVHPDEWFRTKPRVGGTKQVDLDKVRALRPDLIIGNKEENTRADVEALEREFPVWMSDVHDLEDALDMIRRVGALTDTSLKAEAIAADIATGFAALRPDPNAHRVAYLIWRRPWMAAGQGTFIDDMLRRCGYMNAFADRTERYPEVGPAELAAADPDLVLLSSEPYPFREKHLQEVNMVLPGTPVRLVDGELYSWYGSRLLRSPGYFSGLSPI
jgi:ABC-type Fe3+-hydroxamate transport system substrate-binding protein